MSGYQNGAQIKIAELWERTSAKGSRYFCGYLGGNTVLMFLDGERPHPTRPDETVVVWNLVLQERDQKPRQQSPTRNAQPNQRTHARARDAQRPFHDDSAQTVRDLEGRR